MPRIPSYRLHKPSGRAVVQFRPLYGKSPVYLPGKFNSPESLLAYEEMRREILKHLLKGGSRAAKQRRRVSVNMLLSKFLDWAVDYYGVTSDEYVHLKIACRPLATKFGDVATDDFGPLALKEIREGWIADGLSRNYINQQVNCLRRVFRWGTENELVQPTTLHGLRAVAGLRKGKTLARETPKKRNVSWEVVQMILPHVSQLIGAMIELQYLTGMRSSELTGLRRSEIDIAGRVWIYRPADHKTAHLDKEKIICIGPRGQAILKPFIEANTVYLFAPQVAIADHQRKRNANRKSRHTPSSRAYQKRKRRTHPRYESRSYHQAIKRGMIRMCRKDIHDEPAKGESLESWMKDRGQQYWHPHQLRHTRATQTRAAYGIEGAQALLGNSFEATEIYAEKSFELSAKIALETG